MLSPDDARLLERLHGDMPLTERPFADVAAEFGWTEDDVIGRLSALLESNYGPIRLHNVHIPPAPSQGSIKIETIEALASWLAVSTVSHRILCGDFNTPRR